MAKMRVPAERVVAATLIGGLLVLGAVALTAYQSASQLTPALDDVALTQRVANSTGNLLSEFRESQSERRAFLLTGDPYFLEQYRATFQGTRRELAVLDSLTVTDSAQHRRVLAVTGLLARAESIGQVTIAERQQRGLEAAAALVRARRGHILVNQVEAVLDDILAVENERMDRRILTARLRADRARRVAILASILSIILVPAAGFIILRDLRERRARSRELRIATDAAKAATRAKSEFLASMSHEIRTPLNGVIGMTELALDTDLTPMQRNYLNTVRSSADALLRLLNDILDFSKIEAGRLDLESVPFAVRDMIGDTLRTLALRAEQKRIDLIYRVSPGVPDGLIGDPGRLRQILVNLVGNAIKFTDKGEVVVSVEGEHIAGGIELRVAVRDTGIGIAEDRLHAIFDMFTQEDSSTTRRFGGTGLGLTISERLASLMGGRIWVESELGKGSTFHFSVRLGVADPGALPMMVQPIDNLTGLRVLAVDDHPTQRFILEEMLTNWKMRPTSAADGESALRIAEDARRAGQPFQVAILDFLLPDDDGLRVAEQLQTRGGIPGSATILLSSDTQPGMSARRAALKVAVSLMKPVKQSELLNAIMLAATNGGRAPAASAASAAAAASSAAAPRFDGAPVLVVEDNEVNQRVTRGLLERRGVTVSVASNGREALTLVGDPRTTPFRLVLMDVEMPEMDGLEATRALRAREADAGSSTRLPIIAVTAHALAGDRQRCLDAGMDACLTKPLRAAELDDALASWLGSDHGPPDTTAAAAPDRNRDVELALLEIVGGDRELMGVIAMEYLRQTPSLMGGLRAALESQDLAAIRSVAHKIKGSSGQVGGTRAARAAGALEEGARQGKLEGAAEAFRELEREIAELSRSLKDLTVGRS